MTRVTELEQALRELAGFTKNLDHFGGAQCYESEGQDESDPDNCQKCALLQTADNFRAALVTQRSQTPAEKQDVERDNLKFMVNTLAEQLDEIQQICIDAGIEVGSVKTVVEAVRKLAAPAPTPAEEADECEQCRYAHIALDAYGVPRGFKGHYEVAYRIGQLMDDDIIPRVKAVVEQMGRQLQAGEYSPLRIHFDALKSALAAPRSASKEGE